MADFFFWLALVTLLVYALLTIELMISRYTTNSLNQVTPLSDEELPSATVVIAARNEERGIDEGLSSVVALDYPDLEIIVVNDRSTDRTGEILARLAAANSRICQVTVSELPQGWLGKNHALYVGAAAAKGEFILFTDADIVLDRSALRLAVSHAVRQRLDHVTIGPATTLPGVLLDAFVGAFALYFFVFTQPRKVRDPGSGRFIGIGAFNLVRAAAYRAAGTHERIRMRPDDDIKLGKIIKLSGHRQELLEGAAMVRVNWYASLAELVHGTEKNFFPGLEYNVAAAVGASLFQLTFFVWPFAAVLMTPAPTRWLYVAAVLIILANHVLVAPQAGAKRRHAILFPVATLLFIYLLWNSTVRTLLNDGITWRGTHYSLAELKSNRV